MCVGLPGRVLRVVDPEHSLVEVEIGEQVKQVSAAIVTGGGEEVGEGDWLEIHSGFALAKLDDEQAQEMLDHIRRLDEADRRGFTEESRSPQRGPSDPGAQPDPSGEPDPSREPDDDRA